MAFDGMGWKAGVKTPKAAYLSRSPAASDVLFNALVTAYATMRGRARLVVSTVWGKDLTADPSGVTWDDAYPILDQATSLTGCHHAMAYVESTWTHATMYVQFTPIWIQRPTTVFARLSAFDGTTTVNGTSASLAYDQSQESGRAAEPSAAICDVALSTLTRNQYLEFRLDMQGQYATFSLDAAILCLELRD